MALGALRHLLIDREVLHLPLLFPNYLPPIDHFLMLLALLL